MLAVNGAYAPSIINGRMRLRTLQGIKRVRSWYRLILVEDGVHRVATEDGVMDLQPGTIYLVQPGQPLDGEFSQGARGVMLAFIVMACRLARATRRRKTRARMLAKGEPDQAPLSAVWGMTVPLCLAPSLCARLVPMVHGIAASWWLSERDHFLANRRLARLLDEIFDHYDGDNQQPRSGDWQKAWLTALLPRIEERLPSLHTVADLTALSGVSSSHLHREFKQLIGDTPVAFLRRRRLERAAELLREQDLSIKRIVEMLGYSSQSAFNNAWRKNYQMSPTAWRRLLR